LEWRDAVDRSFCLQFICFDPALALYIENTNLPINDTLVTRTSSGAFGRCLTSSSSSSSLSEDSTTFRDRLPLLVVGCFFTRLAEEVAGVWRFLSGNGLACESQAICPYFSSSPPYHCTNLSARETANSTWLFALQTSLKFQYIQ